MLTRILHDITPSQARSWRWPDDVLPLSQERFPFLHYSDQAIQAYLAFLAEFPEAYGRLGRFVRTRLNIATDCPAEYVFREAHIDVSDADQELANALLALGFEADHFLSLNPPEYTKCFTARFEVPAQSTGRSRAAGDYLRKAIRDAEWCVSQRDGHFAYSEVECYTHRNKRAFPFRPPSEDGLAAFPFGPEEFQATAEYPKKWDVHVKIPTGGRGEAFKIGDGSEMLRLRQLFMLSGFYEIRSLSGNAIYTVQLVDGREAKATFNQLAAWAGTFGGVTSIEMEACTRFWRTQLNWRGRTFDAPIPKVVRRRPRSST
jgi:hypothetical protein